MRKKPFKHRSSRSSQAPVGAPLFKTVFRSILKWFEEDLPVTEFHGRGKFDTEVAGTREYQTALEALCGGRTTKPQKLVMQAVVSPVPREKTMRVEIEGKLVGHLKPGDAKFLQKQLSAVQEGPCALQISALIQGGRKKKNGETDDFTVSLCLPPKPEKKVREPEQETSHAGQSETA